MTEVRKILNDYASQYARATDPIEKRYLLVEYLELLQMEAAGIDWMWCSVQATSKVSLDNLKSVGAVFYDLKPARELQEALLQLNNREEPSLFHITEKLGKPLPRVKLYWWATASALITVFMKIFGCSEPVAAEKVAKAMAKYKLPLPGKLNTRTPPGRLLQTWRDKCIAGDKGDLARYQYDVVLKTCLESVERGGLRKSDGDHLLKSFLADVIPLGVSLPDKVRREKASRLN